MNYIVSKIKQFYLSKIFFGVFMLFAVIDLLEAVLGFDRFANLFSFAVDIFILYTHPLRVNFVEGLKVDLKRLREYITQ